MLLLKINNKYLNFKSRCPFSHLFPLLVLSGQNPFKHHLIQQILQVVAKAIYKVGIAAKDLVNNYCSGFPASFYGIFHISYNDYKSSLFKKFCSSCLRCILIATISWGSRTRNRKCLLGGLGCSMEQNDHSHRTQAGSRVFQQSWLTAMTNSRAVVRLPW